MNDEIIKRLAREAGIATPGNQAFGEEMVCSIQEDENLMPELRAFANLIEAHLADANRPKLIKPCDSEEFPPPCSG